MQVSQAFRYLNLSSAALMVAFGCSDQGSVDGDGSSGGAATGGLPGTGGINTPPASGGSGGSPPTSGGQVATGGTTGGATSTAGGASSAGTGGTTNSGGTLDTGGAPVAGGSSGGSPITGGTSNTGGVPNTGGSTTSGGAPASGGSAGSGGAGGGASSGGNGGGGTSSGGASTGGASTGGASTGGATGATPDCNSVSGQPIKTVAKDGSGQYMTVQAAIDSIATSNTTLTQIRIKPGTYKEKLVINRPLITLCGEVGKASSTILTYSDSASTSNGNGGTLGTSGSCSVNLTSSDVSVENITFENSTAVGGGQAVALLLSGSRVQFRNCRFMGYQDTLYVHNGTQYFKSCYIQGSVDFIFGGSTAVFDECTVYNAAGGVSATAPSTEQASAYGLVFLGGSLTAASSVGKGSVALGRNWGAYGAAAYIKTALGAHILPAGWMPMGSNTLATARFSEFQTTGAGATTSQRAAQSTQLTTSAAANYTIPKIFGTWTPSFSR